MDNPKIKNIVGQDLVDYIKKELDISDDKTHALVNLMHHYNITSVPSEREKLMIRWAKYCAGLLKH